MQFLLTPTLEAVGPTAPDLVIRGQLHKVAFKVLPHHLNQATQTFGEVRSQRPIGLLSSSV